MLSLKQDKDYLESTCRCAERLQSNFPPGGVCGQVYERLQAVSHCIIGLAEARCIIGLAIAEYVSS
jgi:hypothetical protein